MLVCASSPVLFFVPGELLRHSSRLLAAITALRNGLGKELSGSCFLRILRDAQGPWQMASSDSYNIPCSLPFQLECKIHLKKCLARGSCSINSC